MSLRRIPLPIVGALLVAAPVAAEPLTGDRPDFVESAAVMARGVAQVESGAAVTWQDRRDALPDGVGMPTLLRVGLGGEVELRAESALFDWRPEPGAIDGAAFSPGVKWSPWSGEDGVDVAVLLHADIPLAGRPHSRIEPSVRLVVAGDWGDIWSWGLMPGARWAVEADGRRRWSGLVGGVLSASLAGGLGAYVEGFVPAVDALGAEGWLGAGLTLLLTDDWQIDGAWTVRPWPRGEAMTAGLGLAHRF